MKELYIKGFKEDVIKEFKKDENKFLEENEEFLREVIETEDKTISTYKDAVLFGLPTQFQITEKNGERTIDRVNVLDYEIED